MSSAFWFKIHPFTESLPLKPINVKRRRKWSNNFTFNALNPDPNEKKSSPDFYLNQKPAELSTYFISHSRKDEDIYIIIYTQMIIYTFNNKKLMIKLGSSRWVLQNHQFVSMNVSMIFMKCFINDSSSSQSNSVNKEENKHHEYCCINIGAPAAMQLLLNIKGNVSF